VFWVVLDGMGYELARRCVATGRFLALSRMESEGHFGPARPAVHVCRTPPALLTLFTGEEPAQSAVWGLWSPRSTGMSKKLPPIPTDNKDVKNSLLESMGEM